MITKIKFTLTTLCISGCLLGCSSNQTNAVKPDPSPHCVQDMLPTLKDTPIRLDALPTSKITPPICEAPPLSRDAQSSSKDSYSYKVGDYVHSQLFPAQEKDFDVPAEIRSVLTRRNPTLDLKHVGFYVDKLTRQDLEPLNSPEAIRTIKNLNIQCLKLTDYDLDVIKDLRLERLDLYRDPVRTLSFLKGMKTLTMLIVGKTNVDSTGMQVISTLPSLTELNLIGTPLTDSDLHYLYGLHHLKI